MKKKTKSNSSISWRLGVRRARKACDRWLDNLYMYPATLLGNTTRTFKFLRENGRVQLFVAGYGKSNICRMEAFRDGFIQKTLPETLVNIAILDDNNTVAVKKIEVAHAKAKEEFKNEVKLVSNVHHRNLLRLLGWSREGSHLLLVLEYMPNGSLDKFLWDFGLARFQPEDQSHISTKFGGTLGYTTPEYALRGLLSDKVDTYSFGIVILEIISGRRCTDMNSDRPSMDYLLEHQKVHMSSIVDTKTESCCKICTVVAF